MKKRKGIVLAGGSGTRLYPLTMAVSKQLMPVYDKPMIYYPLSVLMLAGIRDILVITTPEDQAGFRRLLGDGSQWGISLDYAVQPSPEGLAQAFLIGENFIGDSRVCLILGDNIFYGHELEKTLHDANSREKGATIFGYHVADPENYGVVEFDESGKVASIEEKPISPKSSYAIPGLYYYDNQASNIAKELKPSPRGELEITDLNRLYLESGQLAVEVMGRGTAWLDTGSHDNLSSASGFVKVIEKRQGLKIACLEEIAFNNKWIKRKEILEAIKFYGNCNYSKYLKKFLV